MQRRYDKNIDEILTSDIQSILLNKNIAVIGCGGQGGYILEFLSRLGVKSIHFWDGDNYDESNLNRQIGCTMSTIGQNKAESLSEKLVDINPAIDLICHPWYFGTVPEDETEIMSVDLIFYAADCYFNIIDLRKILRNAIKKGIPLIDCPVNILGGYIHIDTKDDLGHFDFITGNLISQSKDLRSKDIQTSQTAYKCALIAAEAVNQMVQYFANCRYANINSTLNIDLYHHRYTQEDRFGEF